MFSEVGSCLDTESGLCWHSRQLTAAAAAAAIAHAADVLKTMKVARVPSGPILSMKNIVKEPQVRIYFSRPHARHAKMSVTTDNLLTVAKMGELKAVCASGVSFTIQS
jgi:hypothetical protein